MEDQELFLNFLDERINFIQKLLKEKSNKENEYFKICFLNLTDLYYCKCCYSLLLNTNNEYLKGYTKQVAKRFILNCIYELNKQDFKCVTIHGISFPTKEKEDLPNNVILGIEESRKYLKRIWEIVEKI